MKFGKRYDAEKSERFLQGYVDYAFLKKKIKEIKAIQEEQAADGAAAAALPTGTITSRSHPVHKAPKAAADFTDALREWALLLESERDKVDRFTAAKVDELTLALSLLTRKCATATAASTGAGSAGHLDKLDAEADDAADTVVQLDRFIKLNGLALEKIFKKADKQLKLSTRFLLLARLESSSFLNTKLDGFLVTLSDVYSQLRALREGAPTGAGASGGVWKPPESFERSTTKFWVRLSDVTLLKTKILKQMPVLVFGRDTSRFKAVGPLEAKRMTAASDSGYITSIYLDSEEMGCYHDRIRRQESARLFRIRWYGGDAQPSKSTPCFVERKTHHESFIMEGSVKERFDVKSTKVAQFLTGEYDIVAALARRVEDGDMSADSAAKIRDLAAETQAEIVRRKLTAKVRTRYRRTAFQSATSNAVRISLDTELQMINEANQAEFKPGQWCNDQALMARRGAVLNFPYAVLEIKLQEAPPAWVHDLLSLGLATPVYKFSKFLTGCCVLLAPRVTCLPHWFSDDGVLFPPSTYGTAAVEGLRVCGVLRDGDDEDAIAAAADAAAGAVGTEAVAVEVAAHKALAAAGTAGGATAAGAASGGAGTSTPTAAAGSTGSVKRPTGGLGALWPATERSPAPTARDASGAAASAAGGGGAAISRGPSGSIAPLMRETSVAALAAGVVARIPSMVGLGGVGDSSSRSAIPWATSSGGGHLASASGGLLGSLPVTGGAARVVIPGMPAAAAAAAAGSSGSGGGTPVATATARQPFAVATGSINSGGAGTGLQLGAGGAVTAARQASAAAAGTGKGTGDLYVPLLDRDGDDGPGGGGGGGGGGSPRRTGSGAAGCCAAACGPLAGCASTLRDFCVFMTPDWALRLCTRGVAPAKARMVPVKVEPKTYFAAERTFLHWLSSSLLIVTLTVGLLAYGTTDYSARVMAYILFPVSMCLIAYATVQYFHRIRKLERKDPAGYHDPRGPLVLGIVLIVTLIGVLAFNILFINGSIGPAGGVVKATAAVAPPRHPATTDAVAATAAARLRGSPAAEMAAPTDAEEQEEEQEEKGAIAAGPLRLVARSPLMTTTGGTGSPALAFPHLFHPAALAYAPLALPATPLVAHGRNPTPRGWAFALNPVDATTAVAVAGGTMLAPPAPDGTTTSEPLAAVCDLPARLHRQQLQHGSGEGRALLLAAHRDGRITVVDAATFSPVEEVPVPAAFRRPYAAAAAATVTALAAADDDTVAVAGSDGAVSALRLVCTAAAPAGAEALAAAAQRSALCPSPGAPHLTATLVATATLADDLLPPVQAGTGTSGGRSIAGVAFAPRMPHADPTSPVPRCICPLLYVLETTTGTGSGIPTATLRGYAWPSMAPLADHVWALPPPPPSPAARSGAVAAWSAFTLAGRTAYLSTGSPAQLHAVDLPTPAEAAAAQQQQQLQA